MANLPVVCVFGAKDISLLSPPAPDFEAREMDLRFYPNDDDLGVILAKERPVAIVSFGDLNAYKNLNR